MPTDWLSWSEEAFRRAREEDRPLLLFLDAAWSPACRALDAFFDAPDQAEIVRRDYVAVKVDADRRPDVNERYNVGGVPTVAFLTPAGGLLWGAASPDPAQIRPILTQLCAGYAAHREKLDEEVRRRDGKLEEQRREVYALASRPGPEVFRKTVRGIMMSVDPRHGGFGREPKHPMAASVGVLLAAFREAGGADLRDAVGATLHAFARGLCDPADGGFFRTCDREDWSEPRVEKMAEENAALIRVFLDGWALLNERGWRERAVRAVSWTFSTLCDRARAAVFSGQAAGNERRVDRTQITAAAAQMCSTFLRAAAMLVRRDLAEFAFRCLEGVVARGFDPARGAAHWFDPEPRGHGLARSQAYLSRALVDAYESSGRREFLDAAGRVVDFCRERLWSDAEHGVLDRPPGVDEWGELVRRRKNIQENAVVAESAIRLFHHTGDEGRLEFGRRILSSFPEFMDDYGHYTAEYAVACDLLVRPVVTVDLAAPEEPWVFAAVAPPLPRRIVRHAGTGPAARVRRGERELATFRRPEDLQAFLFDLP